MMAARQVAGWTPARPRRSPSMSRPSTTSRPSPRAPTRAWPWTRGPAPSPAGNRHQRRCRQRVGPGGRLHRHQRQQRALLGAAGSGPNGTLTFTPATGATGSATVTVRIHDNGGTAGGGVDTSAPQTFTITVSNSALDFGPSGAAAYVTFGTAAKLGLAQFTIETWFKRTGAGTRHLDRHRRHHQRHPARDQGPRRGRGLATST